MAFTLDLFDLNTYHQRIRLSQREADVRELVVTGLSHLVKAHPESGFKHCLPLAHGHDIRKRTVFARVLARVLGEGASFEPPEPTSLAKQSPLCKVSEYILAFKTSRLRYDLDCTAGEATRRRL